MPNVDLRNGRHGGAKPQGLAPVFLKIIYLFTFRETGREGGRKRKRNTDRLPLLCVLTGDRTHNLGVFCAWELNRRPFALQYDAQPTELHRSGQSYLFVDSLLM